MRVPDYLIVPLARVAKTLATRRGESATRTVEPDPDFPLPPLHVGKVKYPDGCPSCLRTFDRLVAIGHEAGCAMSLDHGG